MLTCPVWVPVLDNLRSIRLHDRRMVLAKLPTILVEACNCRYVSILADRLGTVEEPLSLQGSILHVSQLDLSGKLCLRIPNGVTWSGIHFTECDELDIRHAPAWLAPCKSMHSLACFCSNAYLLWLVQLVCSATCSGLAFGLGRRNDCLLPAPAYLYVVTLHEP